MREHDLEIKKFWFQDHVISRDQREPTNLAHLSSNLFFFEMNERKYFQTDKEKEKEKEKKHGSTIIERIAPCLLFSVLEQDDGIHQATLVVERLFEPNILVYFELLIYDRLFVFFFSLIIAIAKVFFSAALTYSMSFSQLKVFSEIIIETSGNYKKFCVLSLWYLMISHSGN